MKVLEIKLSDIHQGEQLVREQPDDDSIGELAESMAHSGLLQAIGVEAMEDGRYQLLWGDRRTRAARRLGWVKISAIVHDRKADAITSVALVENMQRRQLSLSEEILGVRHLANDKDYSVEKIAATLSKSRSWVLTRLMADNLEPHLREPLLEGSLPLYAAEMIATFPDVPMQKYFVAQTIQLRWNKSQLKQVLEANLNPGVIAAGALNGVPGEQPRSAAGPLLYPTECCGIKAPIGQTTLVRVCSDGNGCRAISPGPDQPSGEINGLDGSGDRSDGDRIEGHDHETET